MCAVTIRTKEPEVPDELPPARLFLDDIEEIVRVLLDATEKRKKEVRLLEDEKTTVTLSIKDQICDAVEELPKIAQKTPELSVRIEARGVGPSLRFTKHRTYLFLFGFTTEQRLRIFNKLAPIFKRRNRWLATIIYSHIFVFAWLWVVSVFGAITPFIFMLNKQTPPTLALVISLFSVSIFVTISATAFHHSTIILRHSSERSALREEMIWKSIPMVASNILSFILGLLAQYFKHKYWP
jgi:hypothetical protein